MSEVFYTSDLHLGHNLVAGKRGFTTLEEDSYEVRDGYGESFQSPLDSVEMPDPDSHDAWLAQRWDSQVKPGDTVFVLGDISINGGQHALDWIRARPGNKVLVAGNHDPVHPQHRTAQKKFALWTNYFEMITPFMRRKLAGISFGMSHYPYASWGDGPERGGAVTSRHNQWRLPDMGMPLLHGHTHGPERDHDNMFHVGVDAWDGSLVPQSVIQDWLINNFSKDSE